MSSAQSATYYRWTRDKPCTTNAVYGYTVRPNPASANSDQSKQCISLRIKDDNCLTRGEGTSKKLTTARLPKDCRLCRLPSSINQFNINRGYELGYVPVSEKIARSHSSKGGAARSVDSGEEGSEGAPRRDLCLWHSLSGTLVHCPNYSA